MADRDILPGTLKPSHYALSIHSLEYKDWTYQGKVTIEVEVTQPSKKVVINSLKLKLIKARLSTDHTKATQSVESSSFSYDDQKQRATISFDEEVVVSQKASLEITFQGIMNSDMAGFYRSKYKPVTAAAASVPRDGEFHYMLSTQFEACDARRAFPCFDEPNLKATFDLEIEVPDDQVALSNMPVKSTTKRGDGLQLVAFEPTPRMSTYLLAWAVGDFDYVEALTERRYNGKQLPVRVYTTRGLQEQGRWALEHAPKTIDLFSDKFGIDYPLPKADLLAVHEFTHGAMENWGLVTYRTTAVLFDEKTSDSKYQQRIAYVVAHELAHQWFGNLVTMDWWNELWLNESFATWAGWYAVNDFHPDWQVWEQFLNEGTEQAFQLDSLPSSHPIQVPVRDALDVNQIFDAISYLKGCSTLRMLANHVGEENFLHGVSIYLNKHAYGNATTEALWAGIADATGADVAQLMGNWLQKIGFPLLTVVDGEGQITVRQSRFLATGDVKAEDDDTIWWLPLGLQGKSGTRDVQSIALTSKEATIQHIDDGFYKLNHNGTGFYRTNYPPACLARLAAQLDRLTNADKVAITASAAHLASAGYGTTPALLTFLGEFGQEMDLTVWSQALDSIGSVNSVFAEDDTITLGLEKLTCGLINKAVAKIGWDFPPNESYVTSQVRKRLLLGAVANGDAEVSGHALQLFYSWAGQGTTFNPNLRTVVYRAAVKSSPRDAFNALKKEWATGTSIDGKETCLAAMGHIRDRKIITNQILPFLFAISPDSVPSGDMHTLASSLAVNCVARPLLWEHMQKYYEIAVEKMANPVVLDRFIKLTLSKFTHVSYIDQMDAFFKDKDTSGFNRTLEQVKDRVRARAAYRRREVGLLKEWLIANGYVS